LLELGREVERHDRIRDKKARQLKGIATQLAYRQALADAVTRREQLEAALGEDLAP
jgi:hypothetical protein